MQAGSILITDHVPHHLEGWLTRLITEWQIIADMSFSDLVLWVPDERDDSIFWAVAQTRPTTGPTALESDVAGDHIAYQYDHGVPEGYLSGQMVETSDNQLQAGIPVDVHAIPVRWNGDVVAVVERHTNRMGVRAPGSLEDNYLEMANALTDMLQRGEFPLAGHPTDPVLSPRVGDGVIRLDEHGTVLYATPNAVTAYRRMGVTADLIDENFLEVTRSLVGSVPALWLEAAEEGMEAQEIEVSTRSITVRLRVLPLRMGEQPAGMIVLCRDVTEISRRERALVTKDATIREIHHRVKNNLQTVAALLRMQSRRMSSAEAKAALTEAMSRVSAIAVVHETLSQAFDEVVDFDTVADRVLQMVAAVAATGRREGITARREGSFGDVPAKIATSLSLAVTELCQNAVEHGLATSVTGEVRVVPRTVDGILTVEVIDDGRGLPSDFTLDTSRSLGLSIVSTLMSDLGGTFELTNNAEGPGSLARITLPVTGENVN